MAHDREGNRFYAERVWRIKRSTEVGDDGGREILGTWRGPGNGQRSAEARQGSHTLGVVA